MTFNTNTSTMSKGVNNAEISRIYFEFGQVDKSTVYMILTDDTTDRWEPPEDVEIQFWWHSDSATKAREPGRS